MTTLKFQNRLAKLMKAGDVQTVHHELARLPLKEALNFNLLQSWVEILSCTGTGGAYHSVGWSPGRCAIDADPWHQDVSFGSGSAGQVPRILS